MTDEHIPKLKKTFHEKFVIFFAAAIMIAIFVKVLFL